MTPRHPDTLTGAGTPSPNCPGCANRRTGGETKGLVGKTRQRPSPLAHTHTSLNMRVHTPTRVCANPCVHPHVRMCAHTEARCAQACVAHVCVCVCVHTRTPTPCREARVPLPVFTERPSAPPEAAPLPGERRGNPRGQREGAGQSRWTSPRAGWPGRPPPSPLGGGRPPPEPVHRGSRLGGHGSCAQPRSCCSPLLDEFATENTSRLLGSGEDSHAWILPESHPGPLSVLPRHSAAFVWLRGRWGRGGHKGLPG